jgi:hypothetical protein
VITHQAHLPGSIRWRWPLRPEANARCDLPLLLLPLTYLAPPVDLRWRPLVSVAVVTQLAISSGMVALRENAAGAGRGGLGPLPRPGRVCAADYYFSPRTPRPV